MTAGQEEFDISDSTFVINTLPTIIREPANVTQVAGGTVTFMAEATYYSSEWRLPGLLTGVGGTLTGNALAMAAVRRTLSLDAGGKPVLREDYRMLAAIIEQTSEHHLARAVLDYNRRIDKATLTAEELRVPASELLLAHTEASREFLETVRRIRQNILEFQREILNKTVLVHKPDGSYLAHRYLPLGRVGICVPGGASGLIR